MTKQLQIFGVKKLDRPKKPRTADSIVSQINVLERKVVSLIAEGNSIKQVFALNGKIQKLKNELLEVHNFNWLAQ